MNRRIQARALQANEDAASEQPSGIAVELGQLFRENVASNRGQGRGRGRTVGRPWASFRVRFTCLQDPGVQFTSNINHTSLRRQGLGEYLYLTPKGYMRTIKIGRLFSNGQLYQSKICKAAFQP